MEEDSFSACIPLDTTEELATFEQTVDPLHEEVLGVEISQMWEQHCSMQSSVKDTRKELTLLRRNLGQSLSRMKRLLAKPGRDGQWSAFLREQKIPRTTADRLVSSYERSLCPETNCAAGAIPDPTEAAVRKLFASVWPKLRRVLTTREALELFVDEVRAAAEACFQEREAVAFGEQQPVSASDGLRQPGVGEGLEEEPSLEITSITTQAGHGPHNANPCKFKMTIQT